MATVDIEMFQDYNRGYESVTPIQLGLSDDVILAPSFAQHLESYMKKARSSQDQAKAQELLSSLKLAEEIKRQNRPLSSSQRPRTAIDQRMSKVLNPYLTQYTKEYEEKDAPSTQAERPKTSRAFSAPFQSEDSVGSTTYGDTFYMKNKKRDEPIRTGSSSGNRRNNPHPPESFMVWKFAHRNVPEQEYSQWGTPLTDDIMDRVMRGKCRSTYQEDYLGIPQGFQMKNAIQAPEDWKAKIPYTLDSCARYSYQQPNQQQPVLKGNTSRYGCNRNKLRPAIGAVPTISDRQMHLKTRTTYTKEYCDRLPTNYGRDITNTLGAQAIQNYLATTNGKDKEVLESMLHNYAGGPPSRSSSRSRKSTRLPSSTELCYPPGPAWAANAWVGPL